MTILNKVRAGDTVEVVSVGGSLEGFIHRLQALGFRTGATVTVLLNQWPFPLTLQVGMTELALRRSDAARVKVRPVQELAQASPTGPSGVLG
jgi:Fe2+ transport system protein FeoA